MHGAVQALARIRRVIQMQEQWIAQDKHELRLHESVAATRNVVFQPVLQRLRAQDEQLERIAQHLRAQQQPSGHGATRRASDERRSFFNPFRSPA